MTAVLVFLASGSGARPSYLAAATELGTGLAEQGHRVVYGGASVGLMGALADAALAAGGQVVGIIPRSLVEREVAHIGLTEQLIVDDMHQRKAAMFSRADVCVVLPGGFGTLEEAFEVLTGAQLGLHQKPVIFIDVESFWQPLFNFLDHAVSEGVLAPRTRQFARYAATVSEALAMLE